MHCGHSCDIGSIISQYILQEHAPKQMGRGVFVNQSIQKPDLEKVMNPPQAENSELYNVLKIA